MNKKSLLTVIVLGLTSCGLAATWHVDDNAANDPGPGNPTVSDPLEDGSAAHPFDAIQEAINAADPNDTVLAVNGTYTGDGNRDIDFLGKAITVQSENGPGNCIIDIQGTKEEPHTGFIFVSAEDLHSVLDGFTIQNGTGKEVVEYDMSPVGGAVYADSATPTIKNCIFKDNLAMAGTAVYFGPLYTYGATTHAVISLSNCVFINNLAYDLNASIVYCWAEEFNLSCSDFIDNRTRGGGNIGIRRQ